VAEEVAFRKAAKARPAEEIVAMAAGSGSLPLKVTLPVQSRGSHAGIKPSGRLISSEILPMKNK
jgi:hypothetical protein